jgi:uncharacterized protein with PQ loop repeat
MTSTSQIYRCDKCNGLSSTCRELGPNDVIMDPKSRQFWESIGIVATVFNILTFVPPLIQLSITPDPSKGAEFAIPLSVINIVSQAFWLPYGVAIRSLPLILTASIVLVIGVAFIILTYSLPSSSASLSSA